MGKPNQLTAKFVDQVKTPGVYRDGLGLLLRVEPGGAKRWVLRTPVNGKRRDLGVGSARDLTLGQARERAGAMRKAAREGRDPTAERRESITFEQAAEKVHAARSKGFRNAKHAAQWITTLRTYAYPFIGKTLVSEIQPADVLKVLAPIWLSVPETARRVRQRIGVVLDWATTAGYRSALMVNAAHPVKMGLPKQPRRKNHHPAVAWRNVPSFLVKVRDTPSNESVRYALEFLLLTAMRTENVIEATKDQIDFEARCWTVPASEMKGEEEHRVPLSDQAVRLLQEALTRWPNSRWLFPGRYGKQPLTNMAMLMLMRRLKVPSDVTGRTAVPHGLRSSFKDWGRNNGQSRDLLEAALAHTLPDASKAELAYARDKLFELRKPLMQAWANYCTDKSGDDVAE